MHKKRMADSDVLMIVKPADERYHAAPAEQYPNKLFSKYIEPAQARYHTEKRDSNSQATAPRRGQAMRTALIRVINQHFMSRVSARQVCNRDSTQQNT